MWSWTAECVQLFRRGQRVNGWYFLLWVFQVWMEVTASAKKFFPQPKQCELTGRPGQARETQRCLLLRFPVSATQESVEVSQSQEVFITVRLLINSNWHILRVALPSRRTGRSKQKQTGWDYTKGWRADSQTDVGELDWVKPWTVSVGRMKCLNTAAGLTCLMQMGGWWV